LNTHIRAYAPEDLPACMALFDGNMPRFFAPSERPEFEEFLRAGPPGYVVAERDGRLVACGGWCANGTDARLCWGLAQRELHGQGLGLALLEARLAAIRAAGGLQTVSITTSQLSEGFFVKQGFEVVAREADGLAPGLDRVEARLILQEHSA
jgi:GNAT superfamily N-acetyltransferase